LTIGPYRPGSPKYFISPDVRWFETTVATWISGSDPNCHPNVRSQSNDVQRRVSTISDLTIEKALLCGGQKANFVFVTLNGIEFAEASESIVGIVGIEDSSQDGGKIHFGPGPCVGFVPASTIITSNNKKATKSMRAYFSPRTFTIYASTLPGIFTSTLTSTRENALKQLCFVLETAWVISLDGEAAHQ
jgi:hypothetical protein